MYILEFEIDGLPMGNSATNMHWRKKRVHDDKWKNSVLIWVNRLKPPEKPLEYSRVILTRHSSREPDPDNLAWSFKVILDALRYAKVLEDDTPSNFYGGSPKYQWKKIAPKKGKISIKVVESYRD